MPVIDFESYRKLKALRADVVAFDRAIEQFEGEIMELGALRAKHYVAQYRADELQANIRGESHEH